MLKKIQHAISLIEIADSNLKNARKFLDEILEENGHKLGNNISAIQQKVTKDQDEALEVVEGNFNGENMIGDNSQIYVVPQNYASKSQLVVGDRLKWILTSSREVFKLIQPVDRERVTGIFNQEGDNYLVFVNGYKNPVKILKASATFAIKNQGLQNGDEVAVFVPKGVDSPQWGAFINIVKKQSDDSVVLDKKFKKPEGSDEISLTTGSTSDNFDLESDIKSIFETTEAKYDDYF
jgi:hypothetical protein